MRLNLFVDRLTAKKLRAVASEFGCEPAELVGEAVRALVSAAPRRRQRRSAAASAPRLIRSAVSASSDVDVLWDGTPARPGGRYLMIEE